MLTRKLKPASTIVVNGPARVTIYEIHAGHVKVGVTARPEVSIKFEPPQRHLEPVEVENKPSEEID